MANAFGNNNTYAYAIAIQNDGKIVLAGTYSIGSDYDFGLYRYNTNGVLDSTFGTNGLVTTSLGSAEDIAYSVAIQNDGKILAAGRTKIGLVKNFALVRYNVDGSLDATFGTSGIVTTAIGTGDNVGNSVVIQNDGNILLAGYCTTNSQKDFALARYESDGNLDLNFGAGGKVITGFSNFTNDYGTSVALQSDGKIIVAGFTETGIFNFALARYNNNGSLDITFGTNGKVTTEFGNEEYGLSVAIQSDGKIVLVGYMNISAGSLSVFAIARYIGGLTTDINENIPENILIIYPNPSNGIIELSNTKYKIQNLKVYDVIGQEILTQVQNSQHINIDLSTQNKGIYFVKLTDENNNVVDKKIVLQ